MNTKNEYKILGVRVDNLKKREIIEKINIFLEEDKFHQIATVNPEFILEAQSNQNFKNILNNCALNVADGFGVRCAFWRFGKHLKLRMAGADLVLEILKIAEQKKIKIFLAINKNGLSSFEEIKKAILKIYPSIQIEWASLEKNTVHRLLFADSCLLFCNLGAPTQEFFINRVKCDKIRLAMGVGGSFDFLTKKIRRAPLFVRIIGLEWLWRIFQPQQWEFKKKRLKRIWKAVVIFPIKVIFNK